LNREALILKDRRVELKLTQQELAIEAGMASQTARCFGVSSMRYGPSVMNGFLKSAVIFG